MVLRAGRVSIRLKPTAGALDAVGGGAALVDALERALGILIRPAGR